MKSSIRAIAGAIAAAAAVIAVPAQAQSSGPTFNGPFIGAQAGWNHNNVGTLRSDIGPISIGRSKDSLIGGVFAGYDYQIGSDVVIGAEAAFNIAIKDRMARHGTIVDPRNAFDISARAGYLLDGRSLLYVRGGYDNLNARTTLIEPERTLTGTKSYDGWLIGGGFERVLTDTVSTRIEYRYSDPGRDFDRHQVLLGVAYRF